MVTVSVIIPNYNHAAYLDKRMKSVFDQKYVDYEVIILDDCSTDDSRSIIEKYRAHPKVSHVVLNQTNSGSTFRQWEKGIGLAQGKFIWIAESDDWCEDTLLTQLVPPLEADGRCVISYCQSYCVDRHGNINWVSGHNKLDDIVNGKQFVNTYMAKTNAIFNASMAVWRREGFDHIKKDFTDYRFCGDWLFWIRLAHLGKVAINGRILNYFRKHSQDVSGSVYSSGYNFYEEIKLLHALRTEGLMDRESLRKAYKSKVKAFWRKRRNFPKKDRSELQAIIRRAAPSRLDYLKSLASAVWGKGKS